MWNEEFKIAIITQNTQKIEKLIDSMPVFKEPREAKEALFLLKEAISLYRSLKDETYKSMSQTKQQMDFLDSSKASQSDMNKIDITS